MEIISSFSNLFIKNNVKLFGGRYLNLCPLIITLPFFSIGILLSGNSQAPLDKAYSSLFDLIIGELTPILGITKRLEANNSATGK